MNASETKVLLNLVRKAMADTGIEDRQLHVIGSVEEMQGPFIDGRLDADDRTEKADQRKPGGGDGAYGLMETKCVSEFVTALLTMFHPAQSGRWMTSGRRDIAAHECKLDLDIQPCFAEE